MHKITSKVKTYLVILNLIQSNQVTRHLNLKCRYFIIIIKNK